MTDEELTFEQAQAELEQIVERLERGDVSLEELAQLWERGEELYRRCASQLTDATGRIEELAKRVDAADGSLVVPAVVEGHAEKQANE